MFGGIGAQSQIMKHISTGKAAKLLSVSADTILKWIKKGNLPARKTAGGHYRISYRHVERLLNVDANSAVRRRDNEQRPLVPCWEYNAAAGKIKENCRSCLVFQAQSEKCYEVGKVLKMSGRGDTCCPTGCEACDYYIESNGRPFNVLIFTDNESFKCELVAEQKSSKLRLQFTSCEYDCSLAVASFLPDFIVVDCKMGAEICEEICLHLANDPRLPQAKIILAVGSDYEPPGNIAGGLATIRQPFNLAELSIQVENFEMLKKI
jgi:excisionase family DNA binding protein